MSLAQRSLQVVALVCTFVVGAASMAVIVSQTTWFREWLRGFIVRQAEGQLNGQLSIGRLDGNLFFGVELGDVGVTMKGKTLVAVKDIQIDYNAFRLFNRRLVLDDIRLTEPVFRLEKDQHGWNILRLVKARTPDRDRPTPRLAIEIGEIGISNGTVHVNDSTGGTSAVILPSRIEQLDAALSVASDEQELRVAISRASFHSVAPKLDVQALSGTIRRRAQALALENVALRSEGTSLRIDGAVSDSRHGSRTIDLEASSDRFDVEEIGRMVPVLRGYHLLPAFDLVARGRLDRMAVDVNLREPRIGDVRADLTVDAVGPERQVAGTVTMTHLDVAPLVRRDVPSDISGHALIDFAMPAHGLPLRGTYSVDIERVQIVGYDASNVRVSGRIDGRVIQVNGAADGYGGRASAEGVIRVGRPFTLTLAGHAVDVDLRNLPEKLHWPEAPSHLQFDYTLTGLSGIYSGSVRMDASTLVGASIAPGTTGEFSFGGGRAPTYAARGRVSNLDVQQVGLGFAFKVIASDRYRSRIGGTYDLTGSGGGRYPLTIDATGTAVDSELFGASFPKVNFTSNIAGGDWHVKADGQFTHLDPAAVTGNTRIAGSLNGSADVDTTFRDFRSGVTVDSFDVSGRIDLASSTIANLAVDTAVIEGTYADRQGHVTQAAAAGPDISLTAKGDIALNETGASDLAAHLESQSLDRIGHVIGLPLEGAATIDGRLTGNASELKAEGTLQGSRAGYDGTRASTLNSAFLVTMPSLSGELTTVQARSTATSIEVAGQHISGLSADTTLSQGKLDFSAVAQESGRQAAADGQAVLRPEQQEIRLRSLALRAGEIEWRTAADTTPAIRHGHKRIRVEDLHLVNGDQSIEADGVLGSPGEALRVQTANVDLAQVDQLIFGKQRLAGRLNASASMRGPIREPRVDGTFSINEGAFRQFQFESLAGKVDYVGNRMAVDLRIQQTPQASLTVTGHAPLSLFRFDLKSVRGHESPTADEAIDLQIAGSQIDLGVVQGFTSHVTNVTGAVAADVRVTGSPRDPHFAGAVDIRGGTFQIPSLGTAYTGLDTRIDLTDEGVTITGMHLVDEHQNVMTIGGTLAVHEREVGAVDVKVESDDFEVIDNQLATLSLDTDVRLTGALRAPRVEGFVEVNGGSLEATRLLEAVTANPYSTEAVDFDSSATVTAAAQPATLQAVVFDGLELQLGVAIPGNLSLRGKDLRPGNASFDFGDINAMVGGAIQIHKAPGQRVQVAGELNTVRGSYTFQGRRFDILRDGRIRFAGTESIDPEIDIRARRVISGVETFVRVQGSVREPQLSFSSNPPQDEADILSLIVFNMPLNELAEGQQVSLAERAGALAGGYLASGLTRSIADALELDELEIQAQGERGLGPMLSIGEQVGDRFFFRVRQGFGEEQATELILEYQIAEFLRAQGSITEIEGGTQRATFRRIERSGLDLFFFFSY